MANGGNFPDPAIAGNRNAPVHRWVPWIAGFSHKFVRNTLERYLERPGLVLDPFAGAGTTLIEADLVGHEVVGFEINPYASFASQTKLGSRQIDGKRLRETIDEYEEQCNLAYRNGTAPRTAAPAGFRTRSPFYSPAVERKVLLALDFADGLEADVADLFRLAFAATMVEYSNYSCEPSLGRRVAAGRPEIEDCDVFGTLAGKLWQMAKDIDWYRATRNPRIRSTPRIYGRSFFDGFAEVAPGGADLLVTSPPYLNNYHYNRNTRPHLYWLGFCSSPRDLKRLEELNFGSYWQNARDLEHVELNPEISDPEIRTTLEKLRQTNPDKGNYGGRGWANYAARYFNDCLRFARGAAHCLRPGAMALVVIGNSILQGIPVPTDQFLARIAASQGFDAVAIHIPRGKRVGNSIINSSVRSANAKKNSLYEAIVELRRV